MTIAIVGCMDRRLNTYFENLRDKIIASDPKETVYIIRDAGGGVGAVEKTIFGLGITDIEDYTHTNCGAMKVALDASTKIKQGSKLDETESSQDVYDTTIAPFVDGTYESALSIEQRNLQIQREELMHLMMSHPGLKTSCELIEVDKLNIPKTDGENTLVIGMAYSGRYSDISNKYMLDLQRTYFVQANYLDEIRPAVKLAVEKLDIHNVMFVSNSDQENETVEHWSNDPFLKGLFERHLMQVPIKR